MPLCQRRWALVAACLSLLTTAAQGEALERDSRDLRGAAQLRRPVALALAADGKRLLAANQRSGTVSVIDWRAGEVLGEWPVGKRLSHIAPVGENRFLAADEAEHALWTLELAGDEVRVVDRLPVSPYPVRVTVARDGRRAYVASLWSHQVSQIDLADGKAKVAQVIDLDFAPREMLLVRDDSTLLAASAFDGTIALIDAAEGTVRGVRSLPAHNIGGLAQSPDGKMLLVAHQMLNDLAHTVQNDIHWGLLMSNDLRWLRMDAALDLDRDLFEGSHMHPLGETRHGGADPAGIAVAPDGMVIVSLGGANEAIFGKEGDFSFKRIGVRRRPTAVIVAPDGKLALTANTFNDSVTVLDPSRGAVVRHVSLGPQAELSLADRGEILFYDARLSHDGWMSCHSCHTDGHANAQMNDNFSDESFGAPKRVLSLLGVAGTEPLAWNGKAADLATQIRRSVQVTMQANDPPSDEEVAALVAHLRTLAPPPSRDALRGMANPEAIARGGELFSSFGCAKCHAPPAYTTPAVYDVGLVDKQGNREFNPPSLRGVGQRGPYFHDCRAESLEDVFATHGHQLDRSLEDKELADLLAFLRSL